MIRDVLERVRHTVAHHWYAALIVASIVTIFHYHHWLVWLDVAVLRVASIAQSSHQEPSSEKPSRLHPDDSRLTLPLTVLISASMYENEFGQKSPFDRLKLALWIEKLMSAKPGILVIDFDLSPGPFDKTGADATGKPTLAAEYGRLFEVIKAGVEQGVSVVLAVPVRVQSDRLAELKFEWMRSLCALNRPALTGGLFFGGFEITQHQNTVVWYDPKAPSLGIIAGRVAQSLAVRTQHGAKPAGVQRAHPFDDPNQICGMVNVPERRWMKFLISAKVSGGSLMHLADGGHFSHFNSKAFDPLYHRITEIGCVNGLTETPDLGHCAGVRRSLLVTDIPGRTVFFGAELGGNDQMRAPLRGYGVSAPGVAVHAATYLSAMNPVTSTEGLLAFFIDVIVGILAAELFGRLWLKRQQSLEAYQKRAGNLLYLRACASLVIAFAVAALLSLLLISAARLVFFPLNVWVNPAPIVLGVLVKFILAGRSEPVAKHHHMSTLSLAVRYAAMGVLVPYALWLCAFSAGQGA